MRLAGLGDHLVLFELANHDGSMYKLPEICAFAQKHDMNVASLENIYQYRTIYEKQM